MMKAGVVTCLFAAAVAAFAGDLSQKVVSPSRDLTFSLHVGEKLTWSLEYSGKPLLLPAQLGLQIKNRKESDCWRLVATKTRENRGKISTLTYRRAEISDNYNEGTFELEDENGFRMTLIVRAYDGAVAFQYQLPKQQDGSVEFELERELTTWRFNGDPYGWFSEHPAAQEAGGEERPFFRRRVNSIRDDSIVSMPAVVEAGDAFVAIAEAELLDWAGLFLKTEPRVERRSFNAALVAAPAPDPSGCGCLVKSNYPRCSPWRVVTVGKNANGLLKTADILMALNPPPEGGADFSWVKPGASTWDWWSSTGMSVKPTVDMTKRWIDFASEIGWMYHTIDAGWYGDDWNSDNVRLVPREDFDLKEICRYAESKNVGIFVWLWWSTLEMRQNGLEQTFANLADWGVKGVKIDFMNREDQEMVQWYERVTRAAAKHRLLVNFHGAHHPSGLERTWPNLITREGIMGNEMGKFVAWGSMEHVTALPFTRFLTGPGDFTPGCLDTVNSSDFIPQAESDRCNAAKGITDRSAPAQEVGTRAHALALPFIYDSPLMTMCDKVENYRANPQLVSAWMNLPTVWKESVPMEGNVIGESYAVLREAYDGSFRFAAITVKPRRVSLPLSMCGEGRYRLKIWADDPKDTPTNAKAYRCFEETMTHDEALELELCAEGGCVVEIRRADADAIPRSGNANR